MAVSSLSIIDSTAMLWLTSRPAVGPYQTSGPAYKIAPTPALSDVPSQKCPLAFLVLVTHAMRCFRFVGEAECRRGSAQKHVRPVRFELTTKIQTTLRPQRPPHQQLKLCYFAELLTVLR
jgi:hypothetical protein